MSPKQKSVGRLRKLYLTIACAVCGASYEVPMPENAQKGEPVTARCPFCDFEMFHRLDADDLEVVDNDD